MVLVPFPGTGLGEAEAESQLPPELVLGVSVKDKLPERLFVSLMWLSDTFCPPALAFRLTELSLSVNDCACAAWLAAKKVAMVKRRILGKRNTTTSGSCR